MPRLSFDTPLGAISLTEKDGAIARLEWGHDGTDETPLLTRARDQLKRYFAGDLTRFDLPLAPEVSENQQRFLDALIAIPYGETRTYGDLAHDLSISPQAAGQACGANPIAILIPCHRVTGTGHLGGFSAPGGVETKVWLLRHEGAFSLLI